MQAARRLLRSLVSGEVKSGLLGAAVTVEQSKSMHRMNLDPALEPRNPAVSTDHGSSSFSQMPQADSAHFRDLGALRKRQTRELSSTEWDLPGICAPF